MSTKMDLSQWSERFPNVKITEPNRKFYGKYLHKLVYKISNIYLLTWLASSTTYSSPYGPASRISTKNFHQIKDFLDLYINRKSGEYRIRTEGSTLAIFADNLDFLFDVVESNIAYKDKIVELCTVKSIERKGILDSNKLIVKTHTEYLYRINTRAGYHPNFQEREALANYLANIPDDVKTSKYFLKLLNSDTKYLQSYYFHVKDPTIVSMIMLITPKLIKSVQEIVVH